MLLGNFLSTYALAKAGAAPAATAPSAFSSGDWTVADATTGGRLTVTIITLPSNGGSAITALQYRLDGGTWTNLGGTTTGSYNIDGLTDSTPYDVEVRANNVIGNGAASDVKTATPTGAVGNPPVNTVAPALSGDPRVGYFLTTDDGTWTGDATITFTYQWQRDGVNISGETTDTYQVVPDDVGSDITCDVKGTNGVGNSTAASNIEVGEDAPLRGVATQNRVPAGTDSRANKDRHNYRWPYVIPFDCYEIRLSNQAWLMGTGSELNLANGLTIKAQSLLIGSSIVPVTYSGVRTKTLAAGDCDIHSDSLLPSDFGLSGGVFPAGTTIWLKGYNSYTRGGAQPYSPTLVANVTGSQAVYWDSTVVGTDATDATWEAATDTTGTYGTAAFGGTQSYDSRVNGFRPMLLGRYTDDQNSPSWVCLGDSIGAESTDNSSDMNEAQRIHGTAVWHRMMRNADGSYCPAVINLSRGGVPANIYLNGTKAKQFYKYARHGGDETGTNTLSTTANLTGLNTLKSNCTTNWGELLAAGVEDILRTHLLPRTTSSDGYATTANQTYNTGWGVGEFSQQFNDWCDAELIAGNVQWVLPMMACRDATFPLKWKVPSQTTDGTHPLTVSHEALGVENRLVTITII